MQKLSIFERKIADSHVTFIGVEHHAPPYSYPWQNIQQHIEHAGEHAKIILEYFPPELEQTIYNHPILGGYAKLYSRYAGITRFFDGVGSIAAKAQREVIVLDPANNAMFQLLYLHLPLTAVGLGAGWGFYEALQKIKGTALFREETLATSTEDDSKKSRGKQRARIKVLQRLVAGTLLITGLEGISWSLQEPFRMHSLHRLYRENSLNMRDMRWVTIAQGLAQYCNNSTHRLAVLYPPAHIIDGILHYLNHPEERKKKYYIYSKILPGITKAIRAYRFESGRWKLIKSKPITTKG